ncbi:sensor domain-containing diguanylate cyclase [Aquimonas voraii]|uniref:diguanylate cyclase n=1 Tax=Aquimonas voraii TaxID=265719 RepID=A0A1G6WW35_9GAMM|nr:tetratricopeptide repeat-containing diguanylate cyclase [Aquimonas voraii]SDD70108.1 diguanylate cyclase (GGDEF) domain-containing protein [Aquimonas voraii]
MRLPPIGVSCRLCAAGLALGLTLALPVGAAAATPSAPTTAAPTPPATPRAAALGLLNTDPDEAIARLRAQQSDAVGDDALKAGIALLFAYQHTQRREDGLAQVAQLLDAPPPAPALEAVLLKQVLDSLFVLGDTTALPRIEPRVHALKGDAAVPALARAQLLHALAALQTRVPQLEQALAVFDEAMALFGESESMEHVGALSGRGGVLAMLGRFPAALDSLQRADEMTRALGSPGNPNTLRNLAGLYINVGDMEKAVAYAARAEAVQREHEPNATPRARHGVLSTLATAHIGAGDFELGQRWSREAIAYGEAHGLSVTSNQSNYATLLRDNGRHAEALAIYQRLRGSMQPTDSPELFGVLEKNIGETLVQLGQREDALPHLQAARTFYETADVRSRRLELFPVLIDNLEALGRSEEALQAMREYKALSDETISTESNTRIAELENAIELERKNKALAEAEAANALQRSENEALQAEQASARALNLALLAGLVALVAVLALLWRTARMRARSHRALAASAREIEAQRNALVELNAAIRKQNFEDALIGLGNRRLLQSQMESGAPARGLLVMADLDHFKRINDRHGHEVGDRALECFAEALRSVARHDDVLVRWGGEEFVWLCRGATLDQGPQLCERLRRALQHNPLQVAGGRVEITASLGFVPLPVWPGMDADWALALRIADHGVYCSKSAGRDRWTGFASGPDRPGDASQSPEALLSQGALKQLQAA